MALSSTTTTLTHLTFFSLLLLLHSSALAAAAFARTPTSSRCLLVEISTTGGGGKIVECSNSSHPYCALSCKDYPAPLFTPPPFYSGYIPDSTSIYNSRYVAAARVSSCSIMRRISDSTGATEVREINCSYLSSCRLCCLPQPTPPLFFRLFDIISTNKDRDGGGGQCPAPDFAFSLDSDHRQDHMANGDSGQPTDQADQMDDYDESLNEL